MSPEKTEFLINMYNQMWSNINRHISIIWEPIGLLIAVIGLLALTENEIINIDFTVSAIILFAGWFMCYVIDSSHWYNRNLLIVSNIEALFLEKSDRKLIHPYFGIIHKYEMIWNFRLLAMLDFGVAIFSLLYWISKWYNSTSIIFHNSMLLPILSLVGTLIVVVYFWIIRRNSYQKLVEASPGDIMA